VLYGANGVFCAGFDLKALSSMRSADPSNIVDINFAMDKLAPMGPSRMQLSKPIIASISGHAVAGGLELALRKKRKKEEKEKESMAIILSLSLSLSLSYSL
jgi:enoyl-CoA hydratase